MDEVFSFLGSVRKYAYIPHLLLFQVQLAASDVMFMVGSHKYESDTYLSKMDQSEIRERSQQIPVNPIGQPLTMDRAIQKRLEIGCGKGQSENQSNVSVACQRGTPDAI